ncbi:hypothetical protein VNI00_015705 [Paramarasmius palmivorus]|uniref:Uncharacterized protein n=1 Tax=Paramarasmius palmivorus TaxID=297713 RepID=A0AAW0BHX5_9AGAR
MPLREGLGIRIQLVRVIRPLLDLKQQIKIKPTNDDKEYPPQVVSCLEQHRGHCSGYGHRHSALVVHSVFADSASQGVQEKKNDPTGLLLGDVRRFPSCFHRNLADETENLRDGDADEEKEDEESLPPVSPVTESQDSLLVTSENQAAPSAHVYTRQIPYPSVSSYTDGDTYTYTELFDFYD